jgi:hypothetical protein
MTIWVVTGLYDYKSMHPRIRLHDMEPCGHVDGTTASSWRKWKVLQVCKLQNVNGRECSHFGQKYKTCFSRNLGGWVGANAPHPVFFLPKNSLFDY